MAYSPSHRSSQSVSPGNLHAPDLGSVKQQRRLTSPASSSSLNPPIEERRHAARPPSPLRNGFIPDTSTGITHEDHSDDDDDDPARWAERSPSPSSSVSALAANLTSRVGNFLGGIGSRSQASLPTDAQLEAEAERERDRSRREAERILTREADERRRVEERVLAMMDSTKGLPPPPSRSQTLPNPTTPSGSPKEKESWWAAAKHKLTPEKYKDPLTPAQQIIQEAKAKDKDKDKTGKGKEKDRDSYALPSPTQQSPDPASLHLTAPQTPMTVHRKPVPPSPSSPTPSRPSISNMAPNLSPSPMRSTGGTSPSREAPPMYAQFNSQGTLDVPGTLLTIARRFEKLEKWTVGHVRALEERMSDVERWLVDKEKEKPTKKELSEEDQDSLLELAKVSGPTFLQQDISDMKDNISELQGRVGELGREIAKLITSPSKLSSGPSRSPPTVSSSPSIGSSFVTHEDIEPRRLPDVPIKAASPVQKSSPITTPQHSRLVSVASARESTSPPLASSRRSSGGRLPYPTGDYALPPELMSPPYPTTTLNTSFSPPTSPTSSLSSIARTRPLSISGIPTTPSRSLGLGLGILPTASNGSLRSLSSTPPNPTYIPARAVSPQAASVTSSPSANNRRDQGNLTAPPKSALPGRQSSVSPTPRKRYTVALGEPLVAPPDAGPDDGGEDDANHNALSAPATGRQGRPPRSGMPSTKSTAFFSTTPGTLASDYGNPFNSREPQRQPTSDNNSNNNNNNNNPDTRESEFDDETIGKSSSRKLFASQTAGDYRDDFESPSPGSQRRNRAQSAYGFNEVMGLHRKHRHPQREEQLGTPMPAPAGGLVPPLRPRVKSRSIENFDSVEFGRSGGGGGGSASSRGSGTGKFVDPLVLRRQDRGGTGGPPTLTRRAGTSKVPVGQLVAFFDQDKKP